MKEKWQTLKFLVKLLWNDDKRFFVIYLLDMILTVVMPIYQLFVSVQLISVLRNDITLRSFVHTLLLYMGILIVLEVLKSYTVTFLEKHGESFRISVSGEVLYARMKLDYPLLVGSKATELFNSVTRSLDHPEAALNGTINSFSKLLISLFSVLVYIGFLVKLDLNFLLLIMVLLLGLIGIKHFQNKLVSKNHGQRVANETKLEYLNHTMGDQRIAKDVRLYSMSSWFKNIQNHLLSEFEAIIYPENQLARLEGVFVLLILLIMTALAYYQSIEEIKQGHIEVQNFVVYASMVPMLTTSLANFIDATAKFIQHNSKLVDIYRYFHQESVLNHQSNSPIPNKIESIEFRNVSYTYPNAEEAVINQLNFKISGNEKLAIVGENGAGKTTLIKLLLGLLKPSHGQVLINNQEVSKLNIEDYYHLFAPVFQDNYLFTLTIKDTVLQGYPFDQEKYQTVLKQSGLDQVIKDLSKGDQTGIVRQVDHEGVYLSGGQLQKLKLAQALYKDAPVLVLDEPTAALDPISESEVYQNYLQFSKGKMALFISHRLASTQFCDRIIYLRKGQVIEEGNHQSLLALKGAYYHLFETQAYYYRDEIEEAPEEVIMEGGII